MSGHSKWAQIKHKKASTDAKRGWEFSKLVREIAVAARVSGPSENSNPRLRAAVERAHSIGLPKDNIERAIARATGEGEGAKLEEFLYEATAPHGLFILMEGITDSKNRTLAEIKRILADGGAKLVDPGSVLWNFERVGTLEISQTDNTEKQREEIENAIIESGVRDVTLLDGAWNAETKFEEREAVRNALEAQGLKIKNPGHDYKARLTVSLDPTAQTSIESLLDALIEHDDVQEVYTNLKE